MLLSTMLKIFLLSWAMPTHHVLSFFYAGAALFDTRHFLVRLWAKISKATSFRLVILRVCVCYVCVCVCELVGFRFRASVFVLLLLFFLSSNLRRRSWLKKFPNNNSFNSSTMLLKSRYIINHIKYLEKPYQALHFYTHVFRFLFFYFILYFKISVVS